MPTSLVSLLLPLVAAGPVDEPIELLYSGNLVSKPRGEEPVAVKRFSLYALVTGDAESRTVFWTVEESGGGGWAWPERYGRATLDAEGKVTGRVPRLLHTFNETKSPIELALPVFPYASRVESGAEWIDGKLEYEVTDGNPVKVAGRDTLRVDISTNFGRRHQLWLEDGTLVARSIQKVFLGRGDEFELTMDLKTADVVDGAQLETLNTVAGKLLDLQEATNRDENDVKPAIGEKTLETLAGRLDAFGKPSVKTSLDGLVDDIRKDVSAQRKRTVDAASLAGKFVGQPAPEFELTDVDGKPIAIEEGKPLLLHFWGYRGDALEEPYGQVGYISFLQGKREKLGLRIVGVAVDKGLTEPGERAAIRRSVNKLREFMRLDYPIALDDGELLRDFGDPRRIGAELPLWVLIDHEGNVSSYHTGYYEADPQKGLVDLDAEVVAALRKMRGRE